MRPRLARLQREGESFLGAASAIFLAILLQYALPNRVSHYQRWVFPTVAALLLLVIVVGHRGRVAQQSALLRGLTLLTIVIMSLANGVAAIRLVRDLIEGEGIRTARTLLLAGGAIWLTNVIVFALIFWMFDRGGAGGGLLATDPPPDLLFPQQYDAVEPSGWEPVFVDYLYTSFTNATAFSPTDVMPLSRWAKFMMMVESVDVDRDRPRGRARGQHPRLTVSWRRRRAARSRARPSVRARRGRRTRCPIPRRDP